MVPLITARNSRQRMGCISQHRCHVGRNSDLCLRALGAKFRLRERSCLQVFRESLQVPASVWLKPSLFRDVMRLIYSFTGTSEQHTGATFNHKTVQDATFQWSKGLGFFMVLLKNSRKCQHSSSNLATKTFHTLQNLLFTLSLCSSNS